MNRILIIEDELSIAELERDYLIMNGFTVVTEGNGSEGLKKALEESWDLVILDLMLPGVNGFDICRKIRDEKNIPIIMVSARKDDFDKIRGLGLGADDYMTKPFSPGELVARVKAHLDRYQRLTSMNESEAESEIIQIRGLKIDKNARRVWVDGEEKAFTSREFDLLYFLASHPDHVYTKDELFKEIWGRSATSRPSSCISRRSGKNSGKNPLSQNTSRRCGAWGTGLRSDHYCSDEKSAAHAGYATALFQAFAVHSTEKSKIKTSKITKQNSRKNQNKTAEKHKTALKNKAANEIL